MPHPKRLLEGPFPRRIVALGLMMVFSLALTPATPAGADPVSSRQVSPPGELMVLDSNLAEVFNLTDVADDRDVANMTRRAAEQLPYVPDIVLLQEVNVTSAANVARQLEAVTGFRYGVVGPELAESSIHVPETETTPRIVHLTTIVINLDTMELLDNGDRVRFHHDKEDLVERFVWAIREDPYVSVKEIDGGMRASVSSLHYVPGPRFDPYQVGVQYKADWTRQISRTLDQEYPDPSVRQVKILGGDLNVRPCVDNRNLDDHPDCELSTHWQVITEELEWEYAVPYGVDHIFSDGTILASGSDRDFRLELGDRPTRIACEDLYEEGRSDEATGACADVYYSDHHFVWALVGMRPNG